MSFTVGTYEMKTNLAALLRRVEAGESAIVTRRGVEIAELTPKHKPALSVREAVQRLRAPYDRKTKNNAKHKAPTRAPLHEGHKY